jgi:hypothetical protein
MLYIEIPEEIVETNVFTVTILANETPVKDVIVMWMNKNRQFEDFKITDRYGKVQFTAPSIIYYPKNITYSIFATKVGYIANEKNITVINIPNLFIKEEIKTKYKQDEIVTFTIVDKSSKPIENAILQLEDSPSNTCYSDKNGKVTVTTPAEDGLYKLKITKEGYANYLADVIVDEPYLDYSPLIGFLCLLFAVVASVVILSIGILINKKARKK